MERDEALEKARTFTVDVLVGVKRAAIIAGANPLKHIEQIHTRIQAAARQTASVEEWYTLLCRKLQLGPPSLSDAMDIKHLALHVEETIGHRAFLDMIEREHGYLIAAMRLAYEEGR